MCGIAGIVSRRGAPVLAQRLRAMADIIAHRGPDDAGYLFASALDAQRAVLELVDPEFGHLYPEMAVLDQAGMSAANAAGHHIGFAHRRLAIIDPGPTGHQPMAVANETLWLTYNGEIYNYPSLRTELPDNLVSTSDTEVLGEHWARSGSAVLERLNGMFAFGAFDRQNNQFVLARDRFGVKPVYWSLTDDFLVFASEPKALFASGLVSPEVDPAGLVEYCTFQNVLRSETMWKGVHLLPAGSFLEFEPGSGAGPRISHYHKGYATPEIQHAPQAADLADSFQEAVHRQMISDVPVGSFLSGGMDSGSIVAAATTNTPRLHTFTGGFDMTNVSGVEVGFDERQLAEQLSYLLQTEHYSVVLKSGDMPAVMDRLTWHMDDPRAGMSYPGWYTSKLASKFVKVCLAGTGGDELFGGYPWRYRAGLLTTSTQDFFERQFSSWNRLLPADELPELLGGDINHHRADARASFDEVLAAAVADSPGPAGSAEQLTEAVLRFEFKTFLNGLLVTDDHISMAHSLETRVPFLDNELNEYAWSLPTDKKFDFATLKANPEGYLDSVGGKLLLRKAMGRYLPESFVTQRKQGFSPPDENWYRGESLDYVKSILFDPRTLDRPWFNEAKVRSIVDEHVRGERNHRLAIWSLISLEYVQRHYVDASVAVSV